MVVKNEVYEKYVLEDLKTHKGLLHPVKSHFYERIKPRHVDPEMIHPNPDDEFSMENTGPNWNIIGDYEKSILWNVKHGNPVFEEPLIGVKLDKGGYMLLNGHHRWMAALSLKVDSVPMEIASITSEEDIVKAVNKSARNKCVTIDLDEVLIRKDTPSFPGSIFYKETIRENAALLILEVQRMGFDVWVYSGSYKSELYIRGLFKINKCNVDGVVNGITNGKGKSNKLAEIFRSKYKQIVHVDNSMVTYVDTATKQYNIMDIEADETSWASVAVEKIKQADGLNDILGI